MTTPDINLSLSLQAIASALDGVLAEKAGVKRCPFVLIAQPDKTAQYVANVSRADGVAMIRGLLDRWNNPPANLPPIPEHTKKEMLASLLEVARSYHDVVDTLMAALIAATANSETPFLPTKSAFWPRFEQSAKLLRDIESQLAFSREVADTGHIKPPPFAERH